MTSCQQILVLDEVKVETIHEESEKLVTIFEVEEDVLNLENVFEKGKITYNFS